MRPRLIGRTHYQVDEPAFLRLLVLRYTVASKSDYSERVAERLAKALQFNVPAANYAVDLARALGLLNENMTWTARAQVLNALRINPTDDRELSLPERIFFLLHFLDEDGAALQFFARLLLRIDSVPPSDRAWPAIANELVLSVYEEYLPLTGDTAERIALRHVIERRRKAPYEGKSGPHQTFIHLQILQRAGLLLRDDTAETRTYRIEPGQGRRALASLLDGLPDVSALEDAVRARRTIETTAAMVEEQLPGKRAARVIISDEELFERLRIVYQAVTATGVNLCPIETIMETLQIRSLSQGEGLLGSDDLSQGLQRLRKAHPFDIRFHVDRAGRPAYLKIDT